MAIYHAPRAGAFVEGVALVATRAPLRCYFHLRGRKAPPDGYPQKLETLGDHLRKRRLDLALLQRQVAAELGVHEASIYNWERNRKSLQLRFVARITEFLGYVPDIGPLRTLGERIIATRRLLGLT